MTRYVCSKMFTDVNIKFPYDGIKNCCKSNDYIIEQEEMDQLAEQGKNMFTHNAEYMRRKNEMLEHNTLPWGGCDTCIHSEPNSLFRDWNRWYDRPTLDAEKLQHGDNFTTYEFVMSSACDLKCTYCAPKDSTSWAKELGVQINRGNEEWKEKVLTHLMDHLRNKTYIDDEDYWFLFSGGEPTYNPETLPLIEEIISIVPNATIIISTNGNTKTKILNRYIDAVRGNPDTQWIFNCSVDDIGCYAEAIRTGLDWEMFNHNLKRIMSEPNARVRISPTVNLYSLPRMYEFVTHFHELFSKYNRVEPGMFNFNMVQEAEQSPWSMPRSYTTYLDRSIQFCEVNNLNFARHLKSIRELIGSRIDEETTSKIEGKWKYFLKMRPEHRWEDLFPHVPLIIEELKNEHTDKRQ